jgi:hypothetical protein
MFKLSLLRLNFLHKFSKGFLFLNYFLHLYSRMLIEMTVYCSNELLHP